jgi:hypothetical protein
MMSPAFPRLHVAVHHPSLAQLVQATQAANGHGAEVGHVFEVLVIRSTNFLQRKFHFSSNGETWKN